MNKKRIRQDVTLLWEIACRLCGDADTEGDLDVLYELIMKELEK